jgi:hypothetical protein
MNDNYQPHQLDTKRESTILREREKEMKEDWSAKARTQSSLALSLLIFLVPARSRRTSKLWTFEKSFHSDLITNVKYRSIWVVLAGIECAWSA